MFARTSLVLFALLASAPTARAQSTPTVATDDTARALETWRAEHGERWRARHDPATGRARMLSGGARAAEWMPANETEWTELAVRRIEEVEPLFGVAPSTLEPLEVKRLDLVRIGTTDKTVVRFRQSPGGVPVEGGTVSVLFGPDGELLCIDSKALPDADLVVLDPLLSDHDAVRAALAEFQRAEGAIADAVDERALVIGEDRRLGIARARLAWAVGLAAAAQPDELPKSRRVLVAADVRGGEILSSRSRVHHFAQVSQQPAPAPSNGSSHPFALGPSNALDGYVGALATPGTQSDWPGNPPAFRALGSMEVQSPQGNAVTLPNGRFVIPYSGSSSVAVTLRYQGPWVRVNVPGGTNTSWTASVSPGATQVWTMNSPSSEFQTAEANAFLHVNRFREFVHELDPSDTTMDFQAVANVNIDDTCNGYYNGTSVNFFREQGLCYNSAFSTFVAHEMGHWANARYGSGNGPDGFGEGAADTWAMYIYDTPLVFEHFQLWGGSSRNGENTTQFCGDTYPTYPNGCHGGVHANGEVLMGALWKVRRNLNNSFGDALGDLTADVLFVSWMQAFDDDEIHSIIEEHWLVLDDDDANLSNGTPHFSEIDDAFQEQGFPAFVVDPGPVQTFKLTAIDAASGDAFGISVATTATRTIVGAYRDDTALDNPGSAYLFNSLTGQQLFKLTASDAAAGDFFGVSVGISGSRAVVGAYGNDDTALTSGSAYVFNTTNGQQLFKLVASDASFSANFGLSVGIAGTTVVVGAPGCDINGPDAGAAYVFNASTGQQTFRLNPTDAANADIFGCAVAVSGTTAIVGAYGNRDAGSYSGSAYLFNTTTGQQLFKLTALDAAADDMFGFSVAISGTRAVVGAVGNDDGGSESGCAYVFNTANGQQLFKLVATDDAANDSFGYSVAIDGSTVIVGAQSGDDGGAQSGSAYVFSATTGQQIAKLTASDAAANDLFGKVVGVSGNTVVIGAPENDDGGSGSGSAYVFALP